MRDAEQEEAFVQAFIVPDRREWYRLMLANPRQRRKLLGRLNHNLDFAPSFARQIPGALHNVEGVVRLLNEYGIKDCDTVYIFSDVGDLDGQILPMRQAVEEALLAEWGSVVCCTPGRLAYYRPEAGESGYILEKFAPPG